jgi:predicted metal-dependent hydrolase
MVEKIELGEIAVDVIRKDIKNVHLSVYPPTGKVRISAPSRLSLNTIRTFAVSKIVWIKKQQMKQRSQARETPREYIDRESHYLWGKRYLLKLIEKDAPPQVEIAHNHLVLQVRPGTSVSKRQALLDAWYRERLKSAVPEIVAKWEKILNVRVTAFFVQRMKTKWGSCTVEARHIRLNTDLARKPMECLEYVVAHELTHLHERRHNDRFTSIMDQVLPQWRSLRQQLNSAPLPHHNWTY